MNPLKKLSISLKRDIVIIGLFCIALLIVFFSFDLFNGFFEFIFVQSRWYVHKIIFILATLVVGFAIFSFRRWKELQYEIVKHHSIEQQLLETELRSKAFMTTSPNLMFRLNKNGTFLEVKSDDPSMLLVPPEKIVGKNILDILPHDIAENALRVAAKALETNQLQKFEYELIINGKCERFEARLVASGSFEVLVLVRNASDAQMISEALTKSETKFREVVESLSEGVIITDLEDRIIYMNQRMTELCGWTIDDVQNKPAYTVLYPKSQWETSYLKIQKRLQGISDRYEIQMAKKNGTLIWVEIFGAPYRDEHGTIIGTVGTNIDITQRKWNEQLQSALFHIAEITRSAQDMSEFFKNLHKIIGELMYAKNFFIALYDPVSRIINFPYFVDEVDPSPVSRIFSRGSTERILETGEVFHSPRKVFTEMEKRGEVKLIGSEAIDWLGVPLKSGDKTFGALVVQSYNPEIYFGDREKEVLVFVSQHIASAIQQKSEEERFRAVWDHSAEAMRVTDKDGIIVMVNDAFCALMEMPKEELIDKLFSVPYDDAKVEDDRGLSQYKKRFTEHTVLPLRETEIYLKSSKEIIVELTTSYITVGINERMLLSIFRNITERKILEEQLLQAQKMESIGVLAGGIAHDFNNVLAMIMGSSEIIVQRAKEIPEILKFAQMIRNAADRGSGIAKQLLMFARTEKGYMRPLSLSSIVSDICKLLEHSMPKSIVIDSRFETHNDVILGDEDQMHQVILNLAVNARDAMEHQSANEKLLFTLSEVRGTDLQKIFPLAQQTQYVLLEITDTGMGIEESTLQRIFEPFFTTKERGKGTGLGLSIVHGIVKNHNGIIHVTSEVGVGTTFHMYFPAVLVVKEIPIIEKNIPLIKSVSSAARSMSILIVDDEIELAAMIKDSLEDEGFTVILAKNGEEALQKLSSIKNISFVISDLGMPVMDGRELLKRMHEQNNMTPLMFMTGYVDGESKAELLDLGAKDVLMKPFTLENIVDKILRLSS